VLPTIVDESTSDPFKYRYDVPLACALFEVEHIVQKRTSDPSADLKGARLTNAQLQGATLGGADLSEATLSHADLVECYLGGAKLAEITPGKARTLCPN